MDSAGVDIEAAGLSLWAKSDPYHPLLSHALDAAAVAMAILEREPLRSQSLYAQDWGSDEERAKRLVSFLVGLHDLGKASPNFQALWPEGAVKVWEAGLRWDREGVKSAFPPTWGWPAAVGNHVRGLRMVPPHEGAPFLFPLPQFGGEGGVRG